MSRGTEGLLTRRWRKPDSNPRSHSWKPEDYVERAARKSMSVLRGDRRFESGFLQRGVSGCRHHGAADLHQVPIIPIEFIAAEAPLDHEWRVAQAMKYH